MEIELSKNAETLIKILYARYLRQLQCGKSKFDSANFGSSEDIYNTFCAEWTIDDLDFILCELGEKGLVHNDCSDDSIEFCSLTTNGIVYMEGRFGRNIELVLKAIGTIKNIFF